MEGEVLNRWLPADAGFFSATCVVATTHVAQCTLRRSERSVQNEALAVPLLFLRAGVIATPASLEGLGSKGF